MESCKPNTAGDWAGGTACSSNSLRPHQPEPRAQHHISDFLSPARIDLELQHSQLGSQCWLIMLPIACEAPRNMSGFDTRGS